jgi:competence protein ComFC
VVNRSLWQRALSLIYPERCCCCSKPVICGKVVCNSCRPGLVRINPPFCSVCGFNKQDCSCRGYSRHTDGCASPFYHERSAKSALHLLKFAGKIYVAEMFSLCMAQMVQQVYHNIKFDCITSVPLSPVIHKKRRYNQSSILAEWLSKQLDIPYKNLLIKKFETIPQRQLPAFKRSGNVLGVYDVLPGACDFVESELCNSVLLVDDTVTTGSTIDECAKILKLYGVEKVYAITATASRLKENDG